MDYSGILNIDGISQNGAELVVLAETLHSFDLQVHKSFYEYITVKTIYDLESEDTKVIIEPYLNQYYWICIDKIDIVQQLTIVLGGRRFLTSTGLEIYRHNN